MLFITTLALLAFSTFIGQVNKARHLEAKNNLGALARAQQAYHFRYGTFSDELNVLGVQLVSLKYYDFPNPDSTTTTQNFVEMKAVANDLGTALKNYAYAVYYENGGYNIVICESFGVNGNAQVGATSTAPCIQGQKVNN
jgi:type IV pilus assembly protein PilA